MEQEPQKRNFVFQSKNFSLKEDIDKIFSYIHKKSGSQDPNKISKTTFHQLLNLPLFLGEKMIQTFNNAQEESITRIEFVDCLFDLIYGDLDQRFQVIFKFLDYDSDGEIYQVDIGLLFSHYHLYYGGSQDDLQLMNRIIANFFMEREKMNAVTFSEISKFVNSDLINLLYFALWKLLKTFDLDRIFSEQEICYIQTNFLSFIIFPQVPAFSRVSDILLAYSMKRNTLNNSAVISDETEGKSMIENYLILEQIGNGRYSTVYKVQHVQTSEIFAMKVINKYLFESNQKNYEKVKWEIEVFKFLVKVNHPGVVKAIEAIETETSYNLICEYISDGTLLSYLTKSKSALSHDEIISLFFQIADSIQFLHGFGIIHRDIKPDNIMISINKKTKAIQTKIIDFGMAKFLFKNEKSKDFCGSLCFASPEMVLRTSYSHNTDIWSLGVVLYYMSLGIVPFDDVNDDLNEISFKIATADYSIPETFEDVEIKAIIQDCLEVISSERIDIKELMYKYSYLKR